MEILIPRNISPARLQILKNFCSSAVPEGEIRIIFVNMDPETGMVNLEDLKSKITNKVACIYLRRYRI